MTYARNLLGQRAEGQVAEIVAGAVTLTIGIESLLAPDGFRQAHCAIGVEFYSGAEGTEAQLVTPTAGAGTFSFIEWANRGAARTPPDQGSLVAGVISDMANNHTVDFATPGHIISATVVCTGLTGTATHARIRLTGNLS
jgi:hypothetical protein